MKKQYELTVRLPEELLRQTLYLCEAEHRTPNNEIQFLLRNSAAYFERAKGRMDKAKLAGYDLSAYESAEPAPESAEKR